MIKILFVCHGNICRSPMAEFVLSDLIARKKLGGRIEVASAAAHVDEIGNPPHRGTVEKLRAEGVPVLPHRARLMTREDGRAFDLILGMDEWNVRDAIRIVGEKNSGKVKMLLDYSPRPRAIADPWYTGDFDRTYSDIVEGCSCLLAALFPNG